MSKNFDIEIVYGQLGLREGPLIVDLRSTEQLEHAGEIIPSAIWVDPTRAEDWSRRPSTHRPVAIYSGSSPSTSTVHSRYIRYCPDRKRTSYACTSARWRADGSAACSLESGSCCPGSC